MHMIITFQAGVAINKTIGCSNVSHWTMNSDNLNSTLKTVLVTKDFRILFINTYQETARDIICFVS